MRRLGFLLPLALAGALQIGASLGPALVERVYARGLYPRIAAALGGASGLVPFALADLIPVAVAALVVVLVAAARRDWRSGRTRALVAAGRRLLLAAGLVYLAFLLAWGLNYQREPLAASLGFDTRPAPLDELGELARELIADANALRTDRSEAAGVFVLNGGRGAAFARPAVGPRAKPSRFSPILARLGISGIFVPFTGEPLVNDLLPESELPFSAAHERAHAAGWAREDEANFQAWRACRDSGDADFRYSGTLAASLYALHALLDVAPDRARALAATRSPAVERDVEAIRAYLRRYEGRLAQAGERVNDAYLRSQGERRGVQSYGRMVDLLLAERRARAGS